MTTIEARPATSLDSIERIWDESAFNAFDARLEYVHTATSDTFSIPGAIYERQNGTLAIRRNNPQYLRRTKWAAPTFEAMVRLYKHFPLDQPSPSRIHIGMVASIMKLLIEILDNRTPPPNVVPTWEGGLQVEWHRNGVDLEIESNPNGHIEYFFSSQDVECEGDAWNEIERLAQYAKALI